MILKVCSRKEANRRFRAALEGNEQGAIISFETPVLLFRVLTQKGWELIGAGPMSVRGTARRVGRDVKAVHGDVPVLLNAGLLRQTQDGKILFPYDAVHVDFLLSAP